MLIGAGVHEYICVPLDEFFFEIDQYNLISKEISQAEHEDMNTSPLQLRP